MAGEIAQSQPSRDSIVVVGRLTDPSVTKLIDNLYKGIDDVIKYPFAFTARLEGGDGISAVDIEVPQNITLATARAIANSLGLTILERGI